jgi:hypothetical protein
MVHSWLPWTLAAGMLMVSINSDRLINPDSEASDFSPGGRERMVRAELSATVLKSSRADNGEEAPRKV